jgi:ABC-2 type transport system permease protein
MKQIYNLMRQDLATALRDNILFYMIVAPLLLALAVRIFLPSVEAAGLNLAVSAELDSEIINRLENYATVELLDDNRAVYDRVEMIDAAPGIVTENEQIILIYEGNEPGNIIDAAGVALEAAVEGDGLVSFEYRSLGESASMMREIITLSLLMLALLLGGIVSGFNIIDEKDSRSVNALSVTPLSLGQYITARSVIAFFITAIITTGTAVILFGLEINLIKLAVLLPASSLIIAIFCLVVGGFSSNQVSAIAVIKVLMPVYIALPIASLFVSEKWQALFYPFPNYWQFQMLRAVFFEEIGTVSFGFSVLLTFLLSVILLMITIKITSGRLMPRGR